MKVTIHDPRPHPPQPRGNGDEGRLTRALSARVARMNADSHFDFGIVDTLIGFPTDNDQIYAAMRNRLLRDDESKSMAMPAQYMFHDVPDHAADDPVAFTLSQMDRFGIEIGLISLSASAETAARALTEHPDRFVASFTIDPNAGMDGIRALVQAHDRWGVRAVSVFPHGVSPQVAIDAPRMYPVYAKCVELGLPVFITVGIAGPRVPSLVQKVELLDQVLYDFPDLVVVMRHGAEPWVDLAVKLMIKWPNLHYSTSAFAPRYYPPAVIDYANTRGSDRLLYGGYFPMGLSLERIMEELPEVPLKDEVWPRRQLVSGAPLRRHASTDQMIPSAFAASYGVVRRAAPAREGRRISWPSALSRRQPTRVTVARERAALEVTRQWPRKLFDARLAGRSWPRA